MIRDVTGAVLGVGGQERLITASRRMESTMEVTITGDPIEGEVVVLAVYSSRSLG
jgi:hypothetical protein